MGLGHGRHGPDPVAGLAGEGVADGQRAVLVPGRYRRAMTYLPGLPSGTQHTIRHGGQQAVVTEVGATLRRYDAGGREVVQPFDEEAMPDGGHGQVLAPWPNRLADGRWTWQGEQLQLPLTEAAKRNAIHGLVRWVGWTATDLTGSAVTMATTVWPTPGYPFLVGLTTTYRLDDDGLTVEIRARNQGARPAPYGVGHHPYLSAGAGRVDDVTLTVPAATRLVVDDRGNPTGREPVEGTESDFRAARPVGDTVLDTTYTDLRWDPQGWLVVRLENPDRTGVELWADSSTRWLQVFSGDTLAPGRRRTALAVEPMSCPPGALASGEDLVVLEPGAEHRLTWGLRAF